MSDVIGHDAVSPILAPGSRSDRGKVERGDVLRTTIEMERQLASLDLTHVLCESPSDHSTLCGSLIFCSPQMTQIPICLSGWPS